MKVTIDTKIELKTIQGKVMTVSDTDNTPFTLGKGISNILTVPRKTKTLDPMKVYILAQKFYNDDVVELDDADFKAVKTIIETNEGYGALLTGQILLILENISKKEN